MMRNRINLASCIVVACLIAGPGAAQNEPPPKIIIDPPLAQSLSVGEAVIRYRTENLHVVPVFGPTALAVSPRVGHIHVNVDDAPWVWADASGEPLIVQELPPGEHKIRIQLETANHQELGQGTVQFTVPERPSAAHSAMGANPAGPAKIVIGSPLSEPLSRGVAFIPYHTENLHIVQVFGPAALAVTPRVGHIQVTVDDAPWHWADASGNPVTIQGLPPGPHKIQIQLTDAVNQPIDQGTIQVTVPAAKPQHEAH